ncbi:outer membrane protein assembly factor BamB family protein [Cellulomonas alba]|uniref:PQQ-binding-like beta-propeller repeat protein n=1 Tax=Cellulomonas alba TaxID=3053467 RepID=A0ABT7SGT0_9CELL|nr:PQQ-binding-like beta-propeller repeat protein [Cellulomonas alba]MDM7855402.1 PQQ-binding-like beta-propeller repeat protein [Cellulomonas alba]
MGPNLRAVELDEDDARPEQQPAARRSGRRRWPWALAAGLVAVSLAAGQHVVDDRHRAYLSRFERVPGVIQALTRDPESLWVLPAAESSGGVQVDGAIVLFGPRDDGARIERLDPATGDAAWQVRVPAPDAAAPDDAQEAGVECRAATAPRGADPRVVCLVSPISLDYLADGGTPTEVRVLDPRTGKTRDAWRQDVQVWALGGDRVLTAEPTKHGGTRTWTVTARGLDGTVAWTRTLDWTVPAPRADGISPGWTLQADAEHVLLSADGHGALLDASGAVTQRMESDGMSSWSLARAGLVVRNDLRPTADQSAYTQESSLATPGVPPGQELYLAVDDGSVPDLAFVTSTSGGVAAYDVRRGRQLWREAAAAPAQVLLDGVLYTETATTVLALDARTGRTVWSQPSGFASDSVYTDGHVLYVQSRGALRTFALADGTPGPTWSTTGLPLADDLATGRFLTAWNGVLVLAGADDGGRTVVG